MPTNQHTTGADAAAVAPMETENPGAVIATHARALFDDAAAHLEEQLRDASDVGVEDTPPEPTDEERAVALVAQRSRFFEQLQEADDEIERPRTTLYDILHEARTLDLALEITQGVLPPALEPWFDEVGTMLCKKPDNIAWYLKALEDDAAVLKAEEDRAKLYASEIGAKRKAIEARHERYKQFVARTMVAFGEKKLPGTYKTISVQPNPPQLKIDDAAKVPAEFTETVTTVSVDNAKLKAALVQREKDVEAAHKLAAQNGDEAAVLPPDIPGAHLERGISLRVK
jgi:hypothetical protein